jgi:hypothetical protein
MSFERVRRIADAVLYEGYVLYPYRASARKNRYRWTFGVVAPRAWSAAGGCERSSLHLECLVEGDGPITIDGRVRFLQVERRTVEAAVPTGGFVAVDALEVGDERLVTWEEGNEREVSFAVAVPGAPGRLVDANIEGSEDVQLLPQGGETVGRVVRTQRPLAVELSAAVEPVREGVWRLQLALENVTPLVDVTIGRAEVVASSLVGAHFVLSVAGGTFVSLLDPPPSLHAAAEACRNEGVFPVLAGDPDQNDILLASPIVLYDHPEVAPESPGQSFDGTEVDELLTLSTRSLTDDEKREARATDRRAAELLDRVERLSDEALLGLHGARRDGAPGAGDGAPGAGDGTRGAEDGAPAGAIVRGCRVRIRLRPVTGARRTDAQDMFLDGRLAVVEEVREDLDGVVHIAVLVEDDPASELHRWYGRHLHFRPDELELIEAAP